MNLSIPLHHDKYREIPFDSYHLFLAGCNWVSTSMTFSFKFISFPQATDSDANRKMLVVRNNAPEKIVFDEFTASYNEAEENLQIKFFNDNYRVLSLNAMKDNRSAMVLELSSSDGNLHYFYSAIKDPLNPIHKQVYMI